MPHLCQASESFRELVPIMVVVNLQCRGSKISGQKYLSTQTYYPNHPSYPDSQYLSVAFPKYHGFSR